MPPYPEWSFSQTRANIFDDCLRKYYHHYYGAHNGWRKDASEKQILTYRLKQLSNLYLVFGDTVHRMCESVIRQWMNGKSLPRREFLLQTVRKLLNQAIQESYDLEAWLQQPKYRTMLSEIYYEGEIPKARLEQIRQRLPLAVKHFFESLTWKELTTHSQSRILEIEKWDTLVLHGTKTYIKMDLLYFVQDKLIIVDWKTGKEDDFLNQLLLYAMYASEHYHIPLGQIELRVEYLLTGEHERIVPKIEEITKMKQKVKHYLTEMKRCIADEIDHRPKDISFFTPMPSRYTCQECNYKQICEHRYKK